MSATAEWTQQLIRWLAGFDITFNDISLAEMAFTHPSYKGIQPAAADYERLEFLGDAVLGLTASEWIMRNSNEGEGDMTERRKALVSNAVLAKVFDLLLMDQLLRTPDKYQRVRKDKARAVESFMGAVFFDQGYEVCAALWTKICTQFGEFFPPFGSPPLQNAINALQEFYQEHDLPLPAYKQKSSGGPMDKPPFYFTITAQPLPDAPDLIYSVVGKGDNKKEAMRRAAEKLCDNLNLPYTPLD